MLATASQNGDVDDEEDVAAVVEAVVAVVVMDSPGVVEIDFQ